MAEMTNLTDRLAHLRDRKKRSPITQGDPHREQKPPASAPSNTANVRERRFADDYFIIFVYALLVTAVLTQCLLMAWLDFI